MKRLGLVLVGGYLASCGGAPEPRASNPNLAAAGPAPQKSSFVDDCRQDPGKPAPEPLQGTYTGLAASARCQRELDTIMVGVGQALGVECNYCHSVPDYKAMTYRKEISNWMASDLIPALQKRSNGAQPWCKDCHMSEGVGLAKILGEPRRQTFAVEWMTRHLVEEFQTSKGSALHCKSCHQGNLGTPEFQRRVILTSHLPRD